MDNREKQKLIFFDFDGVLVDTLDMCARIVSETNIYPDPIEHIRAVSEGNIVDELHKLHAEGRFTWDPEFNRKYAQELESLPLVEGVQDVVEELAKHHNLSIVSSSHSQNIRSFLERHNLAHHFDEIGGVDIHHRKTEKMASQLERKGLTVGDSLFITDTLGDIREGHDLGIRTIAVSWGYHPEETLSRGKPYKIIHTPTDIIPHIRRSFGIL